jgi:hypothetical protein
MTPCDATQGFVWPGLAGLCPAMRGMVLLGNPQHSKGFVRFQFSVRSC